LQFSNTSGTGRFFVHTLAPEPRWREQWALVKQTSNDHVSAVIHNEHDQVTRSSKGSLHTSAPAEAQVIDAVALTHVLD
jgi:hypothetical protein